MPQQPSCLWFCADHLRIDFQGAAVLGQKRLSGVPLICLRIQDMARTHDSSPSSPLPGSEGSCTGTDRSEKQNYHLEQLSL